MSEDMEHARAQLVQIWEDLDQAGKNEFATTLGFTGKPESRRRSARRLVQGSRSISTGKQTTIKRSYSARYGKDKVVDLMDREKVDVTEYFKPLIIGRQRAWTGESPPLAFQVPYRIRALVVAVQEDSTVGWYALEHEVWTSGVGRTFSQLAAMLQDELDSIFDQPSGGKYRTFGIAFRDSAVSELVTRADVAGEVTNPVAPPQHRSLNVMIYSTPDSFAKKGAYERVGYDD
jgi:hypothetical protein